LNKYDDPKDIGIGQLSERRVLCGGSWRGTPETLRSAFRVRNTPVYRNINIGFRLAQDL
jgi:formylglycine-generating enzyme required for sulfatase activity